MTQIPALDWPRRISPLNGDEDLLKQNPLTDAAPQEERIPVNLLAEYIFGQYLTNTVNVGSGVNIFAGHFGNQTRFNTIASAGSRAKVWLSGDTIKVDVNSSFVAADFNLEEVKNVVSTPTTGDFLQYNGNTWVTTPVMDTFTVSDGTNQIVINNGSGALYFVSTPNFQFEIFGGNAVKGTWTAGIADLSDVSAATDADTALTWDGTGYVWSPYAAIYADAVTDGLNIGSAGIGVYDSKIGQTLQFRHMAPASPKVDMVLSGADILVDVNSVAVGNEINLFDLADVTGSPSNGDTLIYDSASNEWNPVNVANGMLPIYDQYSTLNTFGSAAPLYFEGQNGIEVKYAAADILEVMLDATLNNLHDVTTTAPALNQSLLYNTTTAKWENKNYYFAVQANSGNQSIEYANLLRILGDVGIKTTITPTDVLRIDLDASLFELNDIPVAPVSVNDAVLAWTGTALEWIDSTLFGGYITDGANLGTLIDGEGVFKQKTGTVLDFKRLLAGSAKTQITSLTNSVQLDVSAIDIAQEIHLQDLMDVVDSPGINGYLKYDGSGWVTDTSINTSSFTIAADSGPNITVTDGSTYLLNGDTYIEVVNFNPITSKIQLNIANVAEAINVEDLGNVVGTPVSNDILVYDGTEWTLVQNSTATNSWLLGGNNVPSIQTFGTISNYALPFITNNTERARITSDGKLGIKTTSPTSTLDVEGSSSVGDIKQVSASYPATDTDYMILCDASTSAIIVTLPTAVGRKRREYVVKKTDSSVNSVRITSPSTIDQQADIYIYSQYNSYKFKSDGANWWIF